MRLRVVLLVVAAASPVFGFASFNADFLDEAKRRLGRAADLETLFVANGHDGYVHGDITRRALANLGFGKRNLYHVQVANWRQDWDETEVVGAHPLRPNKAYRPEHHFDRAPEGGHLAAFRKGRDFLHEQRALVEKHARAGETSEALRALGRALHALQDFCSHSSYTEITDREYLATIEKALLLDPTLEAPRGLRLTSFDPERGKGDDELDFGHDLFSKDTPDKKNHEKAVDVAVSLSLKLCKKIEDALPAPKWKALTQGSCGCGALDCFFGMK